MKEGIIVLGHGSRREDANSEVKQITAKLKEKNPQNLYQTAFLEFCKPSLVDAIEEFVESGVGKIIIVPMFLTVGNHMHRDIPGKILRLKTTYPEIKFVFAKHLGPDPKIVEIVEDRIKEAKELI